MPLHLSRSGRLRLLWSLPLLAGLSFVHAAAPVEPDVHTLKLAPTSDIAAGRIAMVQAEAGAEPDHYVVEKLTILQPVQVVVVTKKPGDNIQVQLCKHLWSEVEQEASTAGSGSASFQLRTEGDLRIKVTAPDGPRSYQLSVWAGDPITPPLKSPFVSMAEFKKSGGTATASAAGGTSPVLWIIALLLGLAVALLFVLVLKKKSP